MKKTNSIYLLVLAFVCAQLFPLSAPGQVNSTNTVTVCNKGDTDLDYIVFATKSTFLGGKTARFSGWYQMEQGECSNVNLSGFHAVTIGFLQENDEGVRGNPVYNVPDADGKLGSQDAPAVVCGPIDNSVDNEGSQGAVSDKATPPCRDGYAEVKMSFYVKPNDIFTTINLEPHGSDLLRPWLSAKGEATRPSRQDSEKQMSDIGVAARILLGAVSGIEKARIKKLSAACGSSMLTLAFAFSEEGPTRGCRCLSRNIIRSESLASVNGIIAGLDAGRNFDEATDTLSEERFTDYLEACISSPNNGVAMDRRTGQKPKPVLTTEQKAADLFPDPLRPSYRGEDAFDNPEPARRIKGYMLEWEQITGKDFLTEHWSMKPREQPNKRGVLTRPTTGNGEWPNILDAFSAAEQTILNNYKTEWYRVATAGEMRQCIRPPAPKLPRACQDANRRHMIPECFQSSNWREPDWCFDGYERNYHMASVAKTSYGGQIAYGNVVGDCLVRADTAGSPLIETRNNGKEIRGYFQDDNLLKNAFVSVECGQVWRDFATSVYKARTDREFIVANPLSVVIDNMNAQARRDWDLYNTQLEKVRQQRENWIRRQHPGR